MQFLNKIDDQWVPLQINVFSRWVALQLNGKSNTHVEDITKDLSNGVALVELATILTKKEPKRSWVREPTRTVDMVQNCELAIRMFENDGVHFVGISGKDINDNRIKLILGLVWSLILHYSVVRSVEDERQKGLVNNTASEKDPSKDEKNGAEALMNWAQDRTANYPNVDNGSFKPYDLSMLALLDTYVPNKVNYHQLDPNNSENNSKLATNVMKDLGIPVLVTPEEIEHHHNEVDPKSLLTQLSSAKFVLDQSFNSSGAIKRSGMLSDASHMSSEANQSENGERIALNTMGGQDAHKVTEKDAKGKYEGSNLIDLNSIPGDLNQKQQGDASGKYEGSNLIDLNSIPGMQTGAQAGHRVNNDSILALGQKDGESGHETDKNITESVVESSSEVESTTSSVSNYDETDGSELGQSSHGNKNGSNDNRFGAHGISNIYGNAGDEDRFESEIERTANEQAHNIGVAGPNGQSGANGNGFGVNGSSSTNRHGVRLNALDNAMNLLNGSATTSGAVKPDGKSSSGVNGVDAQGHPINGAGSGVNGSSINGNGVGAAGADGKCGVNGLDTEGHKIGSGANGTNGAHGVNGTSATSGIVGLDGSNGVNGSSVNGSQFGTKGVNGFDAAGHQIGSGVNVNGFGVNGANGVNGSSVNGGEFGTNGANGVNGTSGVVGPDGKLISGVNGSSVNGTTHGANGFDAAGHSTGSGANGSGLNGSSRTNGSGRLSALDSAMSALNGSASKVNGSSANGSSLTGANGVNGVVGPDGKIVSGSNGVNGVVGPDGKIVSGSNGVNGVVGPDGKIVSGSNGVNGVVGPDGKIVSGSNGVNGSNVNGVNGSSIPANSVSERNVVLGSNGKVSADGKTEGAAGSTVDGDDDGEGHSNKSGKEFIVPSLEEKYLTRKMSIRHIKLCKVGENVYNRALPWYISISGKRRYDEKFRSQEFNCEDIYLSRRMSLPHFRFIHEEPPKPEPVQIEAEPVEEKGVEESSDDEYLREQAKNAIKPSPEEIVLTRNMSIRHIKLCKEGEKNYFEKNLKWYISVSGKNRGDHEENKNITRDFKISPEDIYLTRKMSLPHLRTLPPKPKSKPVIPKYDPEVERVMKENAEQDAKLAKEAIKPSPEDIVLTRKMSIRHIKLCKDGERNYFNNNLPWYVSISGKARGSPEETMNVTRDFKISPEDVVLTKKMDIPHYNDPKCTEEYREQQKKLHEEVCAKQRAAKLAQQEEDKQYMEENAHKGIKLTPEDIVLTRKMSIRHIKLCKQGEKNYYNPKLPWYISISGKRRGSADECKADTRNTKFGLEDIYLTRNLSLPHFVPVKEDILEEEEEQHQNPEVKTRDVNLVEEEVVEATPEQKAKELSPEDIVLARKLSIRHIKMLKQGEKNYKRPYLSWYVSTSGKWRGSHNEQKAITRDVEFNKEDKVLSRKMNLPHYVRPKCDETGANNNYSACYMFDVKKQWW